MFMGDNAKKTGRKPAGGRVPPPLATAITICHFQEQNMSQLDPTGVENGSDEALAEPNGHI